MIKVIAFDAFGTLFNLNKGELQDLDDNLVDQILGYARIKQLDYTWLQSLMGRHIPFDQITLNVFRDAIKIFGGDEELVQRLAALYLKGVCYTDVRPNLIELQKPPIKIGILSNGTIDMLDNGIRNNDISSLLDFRISADEAAIFKPHPKVYQLVIDLFATDKKEVLFVSSNQWDVAGASNFGFKCAWLNRHNVHAESILNHSDYIEIKNLGQIQDLLG